MQTLQITARSGDDGVLHLDLPVGSAGTEFVVVFQILPKAGESAGRGWPPGFFEETAGQWEGEFVRDQGIPEVRDEL